MENHLQKVKELLKKYKRPVLLMILSVSIIVTAVGFYHLTEKKITVVDAKEKIHIETRSKTVAEVLKEHKISLKPEDVVEPSLDTAIENGIQIEIRRAVPVTIVADGKEYQLITAATQVEEVIAESGIDIGTIDKVLPERTAQLGEDKNIRIVRVREELITDEKKLEYATVKKPSEQLDKGMTKVVQKGAAGLKKSEIKITYEDGKETKRDIIKEEVVIEPKDQVVQVGMNDKISTSRGTTRFQKALVVTATAYSSEDPGVNNRTSVGATLKKGVIAVDPRVIPYYTRIYVPGYGFGQALDTGGAIKGNKIDLAMNSRAEALRYGRRTVKIYLLGR